MMAWVFRPDTLPLSTIDGEPPALEGEEAIDMYSGSFRAGGGGQNFSS
jgi:hypothetical protein